MNTEARQISVIDPIAPALERVKLMLFRPFDMGKWFAVGFCAWLAYLGEGGFNFRVPWNNCGSRCGPTESVREICSAHMVLTVFVVAMLVAIGICVGVVLLWLSSRGRFMFLNCVARNSSQIAAPWRDFGRGANSLFLFRIAMGAIGFVLIAGPLVATLFWCSSAAVTGWEYCKVLFVMPVVLVILLAAVVAIILLIIMKFTKDFVVPIMYIHKVRCMEGWGRFRSILSGNKARLLLYLLFQIVISLAISTILVAAALLTCCCAACIFWIPYIGTVALLPILVFQRAYSAYYLRQYGDEFDVFAQGKTQGVGTIINPA